MAAKSADRSQPAHPAAELRLMDGLHGVVWEADASFDPPRYTFVSGGSSVILGYPPERWLTEPMSWASSIHPDDRERVLEYRRGLLRAGSRGEIDYRTVAADGRTLWVRDRLYAIPAGPGGPPMLRGLLVDFSQHHEALTQLQASEARKGAILDCALDCIVTIDHTGAILEFNPAAERIFGHARADVVGRPMVDLIVPPAHREAHRRGMARHLATGDSRMLGRRIEITALRADGTEFPVELSIVRVAGSMPPMFTGFLRDLTGREVAEAELRDTLSLLTATLDSTADGILVVDPAGKILSANRRFAALWRIPPEILESRDDDRAIEFVLGQLKDPDAFIAKVRELYAQPDAESFDLLEFKDGRVFERYSMPQRIDGVSVGRVWSFRDITGRVQAEASLRESELQLRQSQKMDAIGRLAGGVAHDFNNLLTVIMGYGERLQGQLPEGDPRREAVREIQNAATRAAALTRQLLAFGRKQMLEPRVLDLNQVVTGTAAMLRRLIGEDIQLDVRLDPRLGAIHADEHQMQQVIMNLAINARDAMPGGGTLTIATEDLRLDEVSANSQLPAGRYTMLIVSDTGTGMDAETRARVFEPFFTTKAIGKGTGLGLATVYGIVRQSGGDILVESEPGLGTVFRVQLPHHVAEPPAAPETAPASPGSSPTGHETVLLVEDEMTVRDLMREALERHGYTVRTAGSGDEALAVVAAHRDPIHLLVTDVVMPGMRGIELSSRLAAENPGLRVLYISGYADDAVLRADVHHGRTAFLQKPFTRGAFALKVREVLDARSPV